MKWHYAEATDWRGETFRVHWRQDQHPPVRLLMAGTTIVRHLLTNDPPPESVYHAEP
jgi:hypothetical protein